MERMEIDAHLKSAWGRTFLCTVREVRESATVSLMGIRSQMQAEQPMTKERIIYLQDRCKSAHEQVRQLIGRGDIRHAKPLRRIVRSYERKLALLSGLPPPDDTGDDA